MTMAETELNRTGHDAAPDDYVVGRGKPPRAHQFKKGNRANPGGKRKVKRSADAVPRLPAGSVPEMLMVEATRMVRVKAGGRVVEIPALQAAFREIAMKAARGNRLATITLARMMMHWEAAAQSEAEPAPAQGSASSPTAAKERQTRPSPSEDYQAAEQYKEVWTQILTEAAAQEIEIAAPVPHPDDVTLGRVRGVATWPGAAPGMTLSLAGLAARHAELRAELPARRPAIEAMLEGPAKASAWCDWFARVDVRDLIAAYLPERYAAQIQRDDRGPDERSRDRSLRALAAHDRREHEVYLERRAAIDAREAAALRDRPDDPGDAGAATEIAARETALVAGIATGPTPSVAAASTYRAAWLELREAATTLEVQPGEAVPPPEEVIVDTEAGTVTYRTPPPAGQSATPASLRGTHAAIRQFAAVQEGWAACATDPQDQTRSRRRRDEALKYCAIIERHLAAIEDG
ncbi:hypothetical protein ACVWZA_002622 [Sphingomonas sp. UYAg733]